MYSWNDWKTLVPLALGAVGLVGFFCYEKFGATEPLIRLSVYYHSCGFVHWHGNSRHDCMVFGLLPSDLLRGCQRSHSFRHRHCICELLLSFWISRY
jgi:hypothetical protein